MENHTLPATRFYENLNLLRGFAIFAIVCQHSDTFINMFSPAPRITSWHHTYDLFVMTIGGGGTWFFVFISGFLFYGLFYKRGFDFRRFFKGKLLKVFLPYLIFATPFVAMYCHYYPPAQFSFAGLVDRYMYVAYWYVPFIMFIFLISPVFLEFIELEFKWQSAILLFSLFLSMMVGRHNTNPVLSAIYLAPAYLLGIMCCQNYDKFMAVSRNRKLAFLWLFLGLACLVSANGNWITNWGTWEWHPFNPPDYCCLIKCATCLLLTWFFQYLQSFKLKYLEYILNTLAKYSFTIYFFHLFPLFWLKRFSPVAFLQQSSFWPVKMYAFLFGVGICLLAIAIFAPLKKLLGKHSREIIGC